MQHIMNMEIIENKCNKVSISSFSLFGCFYALLRTKKKMPFNVLTKAFEYDGIYTKLY